MAEPPNTIFPSTDRETLPPPSSGKNLMLLPSFLLPVTPNEAPLGQAASLMPVLVPLVPLPCSLTAQVAASHGHPIARGVNPPHRRHGSHRSLLLPTPQATVDLSPPPQLCYWSTTELSVPSSSSCRKSHRDRVPLHYIYANLLPKKRQSHRLPTKIAQTLIFFPCPLHGRAAACLAGALQRPNHSPPPCFHNRAVPLDSTPPISSPTVPSSSPNKSLLSSPPVSQDNKTLHPPLTVSSFMPWPCSTPSHSQELPFLLLPKPQPPTAKTNRRLPVPFHHGCFPSLSNRSCTHSPAT